MLLCNHRHSFRNYRYSVLVSWLPQSWRPRRVFNGTGSDVLCSRTPAQTLGKGPADGTAQPFPPGAKPRASTDQAGEDGRAEAGVGQTLGASTSQPWSKWGHLCIRLASRVAARAGPPPRGSMPPITVTRRPLQPRGPHTVGHVLFQVSGADLASQPRSLHGTPPRCPWGQWLQVTTGPRPDDLLSSCLPAALGVSSRAALLGGVRVRGAQRQDGRSPLPKSRTEWPVTKLPGLLSLQLPEVRACLPRGARGPRLRNVQPAATSIMGLVRYRQRVPAEVPAFPPPQSCTPCPRRGLVGRFPSVLVNAGPRVPGSEE